MLSSETSFSTSDRKLSKSRAALSELGRLIFLDRYARKEQDRSKLQVGQEVVAYTDPDSKQRELAFVREMVGGRVTVEIQRDGSRVEVPVEQVDLPVEHVGQAHQRIAGAISDAEVGELKEYWHDQFLSELEDFRLVPAGRIWAGAGVEESLTPYNCLAAGTVVHTENGPMDIENLVGLTVNVLSLDGKYRPATFACYGEQELFEVTLGRGDIVYATAAHEWLASKKGAPLQTVTTLDLVGMDVPYNPARFAVDPLEYEAGIRHGIVFGDGTVTSTYKARVDLFGPKRDLFRFFHHPEYETTLEDAHAHVTGAPASFKKLPSSSTTSPSYWRGFIAGLVATDGSVDANGSVCITQSDLTVLERIIDIAPTAGLIAGQIRVLRRKSNLGDQYGPCYVTRLNRAFVEGILLRPDQRERFASAGPSTRGNTATVTSVERTGRVEPVYCCVEADTHTMTVDRGFLTRQCYVLPPPKDSRHGIIETLDRMTEIMSRGGGVGIPLMSLRPRHWLVKGVNGRSSGATAWSEIYSFATGLIEQGGSRRGALMLIQYAWHPDIMEFVTAKKDKTRLKNANVSVGIPDELMKAVEADADWNLLFPDTTHPAYDAEWDGDIALWQDKGYPVKIHKTIKARALWDLIVESAWSSAEPGVFFVDRYNKLSNSYYYAQGRIWCTNPCGEQGIPGYAVCNLGHLNLSRFLVGDGLAEPARIDWVRLGRSVRNAVRFMDDVIDVAFTPFEENERQQKGERRIGLGTMGLGEVLIRCHVRYGNNKECLSFLDDLYGFITQEAYLASSDLAEEKGSFPLFDAEKFLNSGFMLTMPEKVREAVRKKGCRNVTILTQAPTGTVGTMMGTSTGIEPYIWWEWERTGRLGTHRECANVYGEYLLFDPDVAAKRAMLSKTEQFTSSRHMPSWFVTAAELTPEDHAYTQAAIQRWVDSSISKTSNLPSDYTPAQVGEYYQLLHKLGCKGGTVYRDKSRDEQVLNLPKTEIAEACPEPEGEPELLSVPEDVYDSKCVSVQSPVGKLHAKLGIHPETAQPFEVWIDISKAGTALTADADALARLMSLFLRINSPISPDRRVELLIGQLAGIGGGDAAGFGPNRVLSLPDSISKALQKCLDSHRKPRSQTLVTESDLDPETAAEVISEVKARTNGHANGTNGKQVMDYCPSCQGLTLVRTEGCYKCIACAFSKC